MRIHTGEKPFVCAVCARGYRDKRELRKHQASHNHSGQAAPIPGNPQAIAAVNAAQAAAQHQTATAAATVAVSAAPTGPPTAASVAASAIASAVMPAAATIVNDASPGGAKTIVVQQTVSLPSQPLPKEALNMNGNANQVQIIQQPAPLNPATIPLPPSVATALQSINEKVAARQAKQAKQAIQNLATQPAPPPPQPQTITIAKQETPQVVAIPQAAVAAAGNSSANGGGPLFYYVMPSNVPYNIASEGGTTVRVTTEGGSVSTAQLVSVPASAIQGIQGNMSTPVQVVASGGAPGGAVVQTNGGTVSSGSTTSFPASWIIETTSPTGTTTRGGSSGANAM